MSLMTKSLCGWLLRTKPWRCVLIAVYLLAQLCPILCSPMDCSPQGSSVHGILQASLLEWVAIPFYRGSSQPRDRPQVSCIARGPWHFFLFSATAPPGLSGLGHWWQGTCHFPYLKRANCSSVNVK